MLVAYGGEYYGTRNKPERYLLSRRLELQAQCFQGVFLNQVSRSVKLSSYDRAQLRTWHGYTGDEDPPSHRLPDHGTSTSFTGLGGCPAAVNPRLSGAGPQPRW